MAKKIKVYLDGVALTFDSAKEAAEFTGIHATSIGKHVNSGKETKINLNKTIKFEWYHELDDISDLDNSIEDNECCLSKDNFTVHSISMYLSNHPEYKDKLAIDAYSGHPMLNGKYIENSFLILLAEELSRKYDIRTSSKDPKLTDGLIHACQAKVVDPIRDALESLPEWDGVKRKEDFFIKYLHCDDTPLTRHCTNMIFYNALRRFYQPGCKHDYMYIFQQPGQGGGKSTIIQRLALGFYASMTEIPKFNDLTAILSNTWFLNFDEVSTVKYESSEMKEFISNTIDKGRPIYRTLPEERKRHNLIFGTTNEVHFLRDYTSDYERRYVIFECHAPVDENRRSEAWWAENLTDEMIQQIWAEALVEYHDNPENYDLQSIPSKFFNEMKKIQLRHKSCGNDTDLRRFVEAITNPEFRISIEFLTKNAPKFANIMREYLKTGEMTFSVTKQIPINMLPVEYLSFCFNGKNINYLEVFMIQHGWELQENVKYYDDKLRDCFVRINPIEEEETNFYIKNEEILLNF